MYKVLTILILSVFFVNVKVQGAEGPLKDTVPSGVPQLFGGPYYKFAKYVLADSMFMLAAGDTNAIPRYPALKFKSSDNRWYVHDRSWWQKLYFAGDTISLSNRINLKLNIADTTAMLAPYFRKADTVTLSNRINLKLNIADTASMLSFYLRKADTTAMLLPYLRKSDTTAMLAPYINQVGFGLIKTGKFIRVDSTRNTGLPTYYFVDSLGNIVDNRLDILENDQFYLDENAGNDLNDGQSPERSVKTVARLLELSIDKHDVVNVAKGSYFREFMNLSTMDSIIIREYGIGAKPVFDAADSAYNSRFAKDPSFTSLYGISWTNSFRDNTDVSQLSVWENGQRLVRASSKAACDARAGSYWPKTTTQSGGTDSIYVHASNSSNIVTNGFLYEITKRPMGIQVGDGCKIYNMHTRRNGSNDGSIKTGHNAYISGVIAEDGVKHNFFMSSGTAENCTAWKCDSAFSGGTTLFVSFTTSADADTMDVVYKNCIAISGKNGAGYVDPSVTGVYLHVGGPAAYRSVKVDGGYFINCGTGIGSETITTTIQNANLYNCSIGLVTATGTLNSINNTFTRVLRPISSNNPTVNFYYNKVHLYTSNQEAIRGSITTLNASWNTTYADNLTNPKFFYNTKASGTTANVNMKHNIFTIQGGSNSIPVQFDAMTTSQIGVNINLNCDSNYYTTGSYVFSPGVAVTLATMQGTYNQELNSTNGNLSTIFYGDLNTPDFFISQSNSLYGKGGSFSTFDSIYRHAYNLFNNDSIRLYYPNITSKPNLPRENNTTPDYATNTQNLYVYKSADLYNGGVTWNRIYNKSRTIYYASPDSNALVPKWYVDSAFASGGSTYTFSNGLTNTLGTITNNLTTGESGGQTVIGGTGVTDDLIFKVTTGVGTTGADMIFTGGNNGATEFGRFLNNGNFGIGTTNPTRRLSIQSGSGSDVGISLRSNAGTEIARLLTDVSAITNLDAVTNRLNLTSNASHPIVLLPGINVEIGASPTGSHKLNVIDSRTAQTTSLAASNGIMSATFNTTSGVLNSWGLRGFNNSTRSAGGNNLTAYGVQGIVANSGQVNIAVGGQIQSALTNALATGLQIEHITSGTATVGFGNQISFKAENGSGTSVLTNTIEAPYTDATNASEDVDIVFNNIRNGVLAEGLRIVSTGEAKASSFITTQTVMPASTADPIGQTGEIRADDNFIYFKTSAGWKRAAISTF